MSFQSLIIDDDPRSVEALLLEVKPLHHEVTAVNDQESAFKLLEKNSYDYALVDIRLKAHPRDMNPDIEVGYATIKYLREHCPSMIIIAVTAFDETSEINTNAIKAGADDFWSKNPGGSGEKLLAKIRRLAPTSNSRHSSVQYNENRNSVKSNKSGVKSIHTMAKIEAQVKKFAQTDSTILLLGQPGTGKGFMAKQIHEQSIRREKPFVVVNCPQLSKSNIESELFGYKKGSFTGSLGNRRGLALSSDGGTLFFDEIGDMDLECQAVILRFIEQKEVKPFGSDEIRVVDIRIIAATNQPLDSLMLEGKFRKDLFARLIAVVIHLPMLKDRSSKEIENLAKHFYLRFREEHKYKKGFKDVRVRSSVLKEFANYEYSWPGNVRQLKQVIDGTLLKVGGKTISLDNLIEYVNLHEFQLPDIGSDLEILHNNLLYSDRELQILQLIREKGKIKRTEVESELGLKTTVSWSVLNKMLEKNIIQREGAGRRTVYFLFTEDQKGNK